MDADAEEVAEDEAVLVMLPLTLLLMERLGDALGLAVTEAVPEAVAATDGDGVVLGDTVGSGVGDADAVTDFDADGDGQSDR